MRTTIDMTMRAIVEAALQDALADQDRLAHTAPPEAPTFQGNGLQPGVSWDDWCGIRDTATYSDRRS